MTPADANRDRILAQLQQPVRDQEWARWAQDSRLSDPLSQVRLAPEL